MRGTPCDRFAPIAIRKKSVGSYGFARGYVHIPAAAGTNSNIAAPAKRDTVASLPVTRFELRRNPLNSLRILTRRERLQNCLVLHGRTADRGL
jgi:hypothetical protein